MHIKYKYKYILKDHSLMCFFIFFFFSFLRKNCSEMASPRCQSRDSSSGGRCPSDESVYRGGGNTMSPVAISLPPTLAPGAGGLLPQHSAAMAAYLNVAAAAAAQQNRLMMESPLRHNMHGRGRSMSPDNDEPILDFSKKRKQQANSDQSDSNDENNSDCDSAVNLIKTENSPLDLSCSRKRNTRDISPHHSPKKMSRPDYKSIVSPWTSPVASQLPFFANAVAAGISPKALSSGDWNGKNKMHHSIPNDATKALEKMSELSRIGGDDMFSRNSSNNNSSHNQMSGNSNMGSGGGSSGVSVTATTGRHSAWQSHWLNKGADSAKDVLKCVWCKQSFPSLAAMTTHMKETKHCGVSVPPQSNSHQQSSQSHQHQQQQQQQHSREHGNSSSNSHNSSSKSDLNLLIKETMPLPRKLVRGQDVWLGKGAEQTRQILKCMWCGQSFRSLSEMTTHMQQTQHYTNIISQEQIISWKTGNHTGSGNGGAAAAGGGGGGGGGSGSGSESVGPEKSAPINNSNTSSSNTNNSNSNNPPNTAQSSANSHVSAVLTCKVCDQAFSSLKELSNHMVKNAHYKEHIMRSITESGSRRRQTREKRKKSLPVRKLLELERAQHDFKNGDNNVMMNNKPLRDLSAGRISCEKCGDKIDTALFVDHIRQCIGSSSAISPAQKLKSALMSNTIIPPDSLSPVITPNSRDGRISDSDMTSPSSMRQRSPLSTTNSLDLSNKSSSQLKDTEKTSSSPSVLNAIEQLIEKSFDTRSRHGTTNFPSVNQSSNTLGSSILKRLGIDESVDYTKPLVDAQTLTLLRNYHSHQNYLASQYGRRERSGSESSSISERGSSRVDSLTPEKKYDVHGSLRATPDHKNNTTNNDSDDDKPLKIKKELPDEMPLELNNKRQHHLKSPTIMRNIKKETHDDDEDEENDVSRNNSRESAHNNNETDDEDDKPLKLIRANVLSNNRGSPLASSNMHSPANSPISDHHSIASRSTPNVVEQSGNNKKSMSSGSLGALSSMFDNLGNVEKPSTENGQGKRPKAHPLAALQKLCDKTENNPNSRSNSNNQNSTLLSASPSLQQHNNNNNSNRTGAILAFSWACNDGMMSEDSNIKCAYCDTSFSSKGAYRHHLSKAHFVNDAASPEPIPLKSNSTKMAPSPKSPLSPKSNASGGSNGLALPLLKKSPSPLNSQQQQQQMSANERHNNKSEISVATSTSSSATFDESPHSKFLKYTELAKQLSSKYV